MAQQLDPMPHLAARTIRIATDNRMHAHEWLQDSAGRLFKADALDHHAGHDLIGAQNIEWDIAGAANAFGLAEDKIEQLCLGVEKAGGSAICRPLVPRLQLCSMAFEIGRLALAAEANASTGEQQRLLLAREGAARWLERRLCHSS